MIEIATMPHVTSIYLGRYGHAKGPLRLIRFSRFSRGSFSQMIDPEFQPAVIQFPFL